MDVGKRCKEGVCMGVGCGCVTHLGWVNPPIQPCVGRYCVCMGVGCMMRVWVCN